MIFSLFSSLVHLILKGYCEEKFCLPWEKGLNIIRRVLVGLCRKSLKPYSRTRQINFTSLARSKYRLWYNDVANI